MGTWAIDAFGNDDAADWALEFAKANDIARVEQTLDRALAADCDYLEAPQAMEGLAAIEVIARLQGNGGERSAYSEPIDRWVEANPSLPGGDLVGKALQLLDLVVGPDSELNELWQESADYSAWLGSIAELRARIRV